MTETMTITLDGENAKAAVLKALEGYTFEFQSTVVGPITGRIVEIGQSVGSLDQELKVFTGTEDIWLPLTEIAGAEYL